MALLHRSKALSCLLRHYRRGSASLSLHTSSITLNASCSSSYLSSLSTDQSLCSYTTSAIPHGCIFSHSCNLNCWVLNKCAGFPHIFARNCSSSEFPLPASPGEYEGGGEGEEADGAPLNVEEGGDPASMDVVDDPNLPPYDESMYPEDEEEEFVDEDPPTDPEEKLLYSPSDEERS
ncbi:hypothetical protein KP509_05G072600 [Ceratopteris richardii]|uniref:Uncharacterized protein n=1 Tax=Ceratopteris richardii TaxID=49495 RepID=A0A8T2UZJ4_CERRI|nr:hypothetical protein KP509_05G072600 [Ceratopteris richardii]